MKEWAVWLWMKGVRTDSGYEDEAETGSLFDLLHSLREKRTAISSFKLTQEARTDLLKRLSFSAKILALPESGEDLAGRFLQAGFIEAWLDQPRRIAARRRSLKSSARGRSKRASSRHTGRSRTRRSRTAK
jgi:hypothetical protein